VNSILATPLVSVVIVAHSVRHELERCLGSIAAHAGVSTETILVDNASTDDTLTWVQMHHPDVRVVELPRNIGVAARNEGLRLVQGRYVMFLDSDAALTEGALPALVVAMDANPHWGLVGPKLVYDDGRLQLSSRRFPPLLLPILRRPPLGRFFEGGATVERYLMADIDHSRTRRVLYVLGACQLFRSSLLPILGRVDEWVFLGLDDADWCIRVHDAGSEVMYFPEATVVHAYRRLTSKQPLSQAAFRHLVAHLRFHLKYARRRRELIRLCSELDREASTR
jgi:GT2 family glycosyltransferase